MYVKPGDIVVVGTIDTTPAPVEQRIQISAGQPIQLRSNEVPTELVLARTIAYLPRGLSYALFAPFPWLIERPIDAAAIPDMLLWYVCLAAAVATLVRERGRWRTLFVLGAYSLGVLLLLSLAEGNVGTLYRHRAMIAPWILLLSTPMLVDNLPGSVTRSFRSGISRMLRPASAD